MEIGFGKEVISGFIIPDEELREDVSIKSSFPILYLQGNLFPTKATGPRILVLVPIFTFVSMRKRLMRDQQIEITKGFRFSNEPSIC
ncbi:hypothetical protein LEP1GSC193_2253 [Leptospira alstonii serovar Pingchang str. 80-412]|uniref:Uncharacterized protein n=1 Tax=Leptospira alstonii serovar Pingchang str. 80-412 TaxID=1218564 RepID=T0G0E9_9LEPT|nr:hypothetical protein LEP1GSC193_2253 [Leptospira alstonii serovar Pingchang str. 80-412]